MPRKHRDDQEKMKSRDDSQRKIGRRQFLATSGAVAGAAMLGGLAHAKAPNSKPGAAPVKAEPAKSWIAPKAIPVHHGWRPVDTAFYQISANDPDYLEIFGYCDAQSYAAGDTVRLHITTTAPTFDLEIYRDGPQPETVYKKEGLRGQFTPTPEDAFRNGCNWPVLHEVKIPANWKSGAYIVVLRVEKDGTKRENEAFFVLRGNGQNRIAYLLTTCTWMAYNAWGGGSHYWGIDGPSPVLSFARPWERGFIVAPPSVPYESTVPYKLRFDHEPDFAGGLFTAYPVMMGLGGFCAASGWAEDNRHFAVWAEKNGYEMDYLAQTDLENGPEVLRPYDVVIVTGHDEYWSWNQRDAMDAYVEGGGRMARFAGNILWQVRIEDNKQVSYKFTAEERDPVRNDPKRRHLLTSTWDNRLVKRPAAQTFGVTGLQGIMAATPSGARRSHGGFIVYRPKHWAFEGTGLGYADSFGEREGIVGPEVDGLPYTIEYGIPRPTGELGALKDTEILALTPAVVAIMDETGLGEGAKYSEDLDPLAMFFTHEVTGKSDPETVAKYSQGSCQMVVARKGKGEIFCAGSWYWFLGLKWRSSTVERITHNVLQRYTGKS